MLKKKEVQSNPRTMQPVLKSILADDSENDMKARELSNYMQFLDNMRY